MSKKTFRIPCTWEMVGEYVVEAENLEEAIVAAEDGELPNGDYVSDSFRVVHDEIPYYTPELGITQEEIDVVRKKIYGE